MVAVCVAVLATVAVGNQDESDALLSARVITKQTGTDLGSHGSWPITSTRMGTTVDGKYCLTNWAADHKQHQKRETLAQCNADCLASDGCLGTSFGLATGSRSEYCVMCTAGTDLGSHSSWQWTPKEEAPATVTHSYIPDSELLPKIAEVLESMKDEFKGEKGDKGDKGDSGDDGRHGNHGVDGENGEKGDSGVNGNHGTDGQNGAKGDKGDQGNDGVDGEKGEKGNSGVNGNHGRNGQNGAKGAKGDKGDPADVCVWSQEGVNKYIGGCSKNCQHFDTAQKAMSACNAETTCGGVTYQRGGSSPRGGFQLRSGGSLHSSPSNERSWLCHRR